MENTSYVGLHCPAREQLVAVSAVVPIEGENITTYTHPFARKICFLRSFFLCFFLGSILLHTVLELHNSHAEALWGREVIASGYCEYR
jgi:hypothetical protein